MTCTEYKQEREKRGTQQHVAALLGVSRVTIARRETGTRPVTREAALAIFAIPEKQAKISYSELLDCSLDLLAGWCEAVKNQGTSWDDWDEWYKDAAYRPGPLRGMLDEKMQKLEKEREEGEKELAQHGNISTY